MKQSKILLLLALMWQTSRAEEWIPTELRSLGPTVAVGSLYSSGKTLIGLEWGWPRKMFLYDMEKKTWRQSERQLVGDQNFRSFDILGDVIAFAYPCASERSCIDVSRDGGNTFQRFFDFTFTSGNIQIVPETMTVIAQGGNDRGRITRESPKNFEIIQDFGTSKLPFQFKENKTIFWVDPQQIYFSEDDGLLWSPFHEQSLLEFITASKLDRKNKKLYVLNHIPKAMQLQIFDLTQSPVEKTAILLPRDQYPFVSRLNINSNGTIYLVASPLSVSEEDRTKCKTYVSKDHGKTFEVLIAPKNPDGTYKTIASLEVDDDDRVWVTTGKEVYWLKL